MKYNFRMIENGISKNIILEVNDDRFILSGESSNEIVYMSDIVLFKQGSNVLKLVLASERLIVLEGNQVFEIVKFLKDFSSYNNDIMINKTNLMASQKNPIKVCFIYTIIFITVYDGLVGVSVADKMGVSYFSAFIGSVLGGVDYYPWDFIQKMSLVLLILEVILYSIHQSSLKKAYIDILLSNQDVSYGSDIESNKYEELEKLKELLDKNIITQDDFDRKKNEILNR